MEETKSHMVIVFVACGFSGFFVGLVVGLLL